MKSLTRGLRVLGRFTAETPEWGASELARAAGLDRVLAWRTLRTLCIENFVIQDAATKRYRLGPRVIQLAGSILANLDPFAEAKPHMAALWQETQETVRFVLRSDTMIVVANVLECPLPVRIAGNIGRHVPMYCTAAGRAFLAFGSEALRREVLGTKLEMQTAHTLTDPAAILAKLEIVRREGVCIEEQEMTEYASAIAGPIFGRSGEEPAACIAVMGPSVRLTRARLEALAPRMREICRAVSAGLGCTHLPF
jgi:DNA-binding IclR family transcriptional regulator